MMTPVNIQNNLRGYFKLVVKDKNGNVKRETPEIPNQITMAGLTRWASAPIAARFSYPSGNTGRAGACGLGTGSSTPLVTNTDLDNRVATQAMPTSVTYGNLGAPDYVGTCVVRFDFAIGSLNGNYSEIGIGFTNFFAGGSPPSQLTWQGLFCRALIKDEFGNPTTITVLSDEQLEVYYTIENTIPQNDVVTQLTVNGVERTITVRSLGVNGSGDVPSWYDQAVGSMGSSPLLQNPLGWSPSTTTVIALASTQSTLNATTSSTLPSGTQRTSQSVLVSEEITGIGWRKKVRYFWNTSAANQTNNLFVVACNSTYQILVQPGLVKTSLDTMTLDVTFEVYIVPPV